MQIIIRNRDCLNIILIAFIIVSITLLEMSCYPEVTVSNFPSGNTTATITQSYDDAISQGLISDTTSWSKIGYNPSVGVSAEILSPYSGTITWLSGASKLQLVSDSTNDKPGGTGAENITITYLDTNYVQCTETLNLNGTVSCNTTNTNYFRVQNMRTHKVGTNGSPIGNITLKNANAPTQIIDYMAAGENRAKQLVWTVPAGYTLYVTEISATSASGKSVRIVTRATWDNQNLRAGTPGLQFWGYTEMYLNNSAIVIPLVPAIKLPEKTDIKVDAISDSASASTTCGLRGYLKKN